MAIVLDGTAGITVSGNSTLGDATTDTLNVANGNLILNASGNLGLGVTPSAWGGTYRMQQIGIGAAVGGRTAAITQAYLSANWYQDGSGNKYIGSGAATQYQQDAGAHYWFNAASGTAGNAITFTQAMTLDASGNLGVGTTSPSQLLDVRGTSSPTIKVRNNTATTDTYAQFLFEGANTFSGTSTSYIRSITSNSGNSSTALTFGTNADGGGTAAERARIDSSGNLLVGLTTAAGSERLSVTGNVANNIARFVNSNASPYGPLIQYPTGVDPNGTSNEFIDCRGNATTVRFQVRSNGGVVNYSANNVNLSDERTKTDIQNAGDYLAKICAIPVRTFKYKDQTDDLLNLGVIAQEVEAVAPELVDVSGFGETPEDGVPLKAIYQTDLQYALMKALQELKAEFDAYKATHP